MLHANLEGTGILSDVLAIVSGSVFLPFAKDKTLLDSSVDVLLEVHSATHDQVVNDNAHHAKKNR